MEKMAERIEQAQEAVNHARDELRKNCGTDFVTVVFKNGFITMPKEEFDKMPKTKKKKLLKEAEVVSCLDKSTETWKGGKYK